MAVVCGRPNYAFNGPIYLFIFLSGSTIWFRAFRWKWRGIWIVSVFCVCARAKWLASTLERNERFEITFSVKIRKWNRMALFVFYFMGFFVSLSRLLCYDFSCESEMMMSDGFNQNYYADGDWGISGVCARALQVFPISLHRWNLMWPN